jgi:1-aminocyclopropane-1-carboxylate deaminase
LIPPIDLSKAVVETIDLPSLRDKNISLHMLRLDRIHPVISGNKWFKLKYYVDDYNQHPGKGILSFGGAWSNHIIAVACTCSMKNIASVGIIRGERPATPSFTLQQAEQYGMQLLFTSREKYKTKDDPAFLLQLAADLPGYYFIPEGGAGHFGEKGAGAILDLIDQQRYTHVVAAVGTGTMLRGLKKAAKDGLEVIGISVLKGYGKYTPELIAFMNDFYRATNIPTDFVYTGKMMHTLIDQIIEGYYPPGSKILSIHSGGLQGNISMPKGSLIF